MEIIGVAFLLVGALYSFVIAVSPVSLWDGRSIWLFRAHQLSNHGMFALPDMLNMDSEWSHPDYPLLYPAWLAYFGGHPFSERNASLAIGVLFVSLLVLIWYFARVRPWLMNVIRTRRWMRPDSTARR